MQLSDTTNGQGMIQEYEFLTQLGNTNVSNNQANLNDAIRRFNKWYFKVGTWILESQDEWDWDDTNKTDYPILTTNLVASQQDYSLPGDIFKIKKLDVKLDGTNWEEAKPLDTSEVDFPLDTTTISEKFSTDLPFYDFQYGAIFLYPIPSSNVTAGLKIWISREMTKFTNQTAAATLNVTTQPGFDENFHDIIPLGAAYEWCLVHKKPQVEYLKQELLEAEQRLKNWYANKQEDRRNRMYPNNQIMEDSI